MSEKKKPRVQQRSPENTTVAFSCSKKILAQTDEAARQERRTRSAFQRYAPPWSRQNERAACYV